MEGADIFNFYHHGDLVYLKEAYENIMADQGKPFKSRPYRFKAKNGCYLTLETVWSCFINPWSKKLEFVDAKHTILKGPANKEIFVEPGETAEAETTLESPPSTSASPQEEVADPKQVSWGLLIVNCFVVLLWYYCGRSNSSKGRKASFWATEWSRKVETVKLGCICSGYKIPVCKIRFCVRNIPLPFK